MQKIKFGKNVYYYDEHVVGKVFQDVLHIIELGNSPNIVFGERTFATTKLMQSANIVVDTHSNTVLKCRYSIEELIDSYVKHN